MAFRFDMQGKTLQQQIIVAKRDMENKQMQKEADERDTEKKSPAGVNTDILILSIDKDTCPTQDNIITKQQCSKCRYYKELTMYKGQPCIKCSYKLDNETMN